MSRTWEEMLSDPIEGEEYEPNNKQVITCLYCKQPLKDLHAISGRKYDPHLATFDQDFGCDLNPNNTDESVGEHHPDLENYYSQPLCGDHLVPVTECDCLKLSKRSRGGERV